MQVLTPCAPSYPTHCFFLKIGNFSEIIFPSVVVSLAAFPNENLQRHKWQSRERVGQVVQLVAVLLVLFYSTLKCRGVTFLDVQSYSMNMLELCKSYKSKDVLYWTMNNKCKELKFKDRLFQFKTSIVLKTLKVPLTSERYWRLEILF